MRGGLPLVHMCNGPHTPHILHGRVFDEGFDVREGHPPAKSMDRGGRREVVLALPEHIKCLPTYQFQHKFTHRIQTQPSRPLYSKKTVFFFSPKRCCRCGF